MSCPEWPAVTGADGSAVTADMWKHAERCAACHQAALRVDPTLVFRGLPTIETTEADIVRMQDAVAAMRRGKAMEAMAEPSHTERRAGGRSRRWLPLVAALAAVVLMTLVLPPTPEPLPQSVVAVSPTAEGEALPGWLERWIADQPLVDNVDGRDVTQVDGDEFSMVVMTVPDLEVASLDV